MKATWIWYPGDFEVWLGNKFNNRRTERGAFFPPFWKQDSHWPTVVFTKIVDLDKPETITICAEGQFNLAIDGKLQAIEFSAQDIVGTANSQFSILNSQVTIPSGQHTLALKVWNQATPPALFIDSPTIKTNSSWLVTYEDKIWIDENGQAHGSGIYVPAGVAHLVGHASKRADSSTAATLGSVAHYGFDSPDTPPSQFRLPTKPLRPVCRNSVTTDGCLYDFGRETFGYLRIHGLKGTVHIYYGESREEALDKEHCETLDILSEGGQLGSKAFRFVYIEKEESASYDDVTLDFEYAPFSPEKSGSFRCSDEELNRIWEIAAYTLDLTTREFFCDGIKRDRWVWSGDAIQSYLMNYYLRFDTECVKRTIRQLRGKDPVTAHVNTIMDYTFYWFKSIADYYLYTGDINFIREMWPKMVSLMNYVLSRLNDDILAEGKPDDWIFVDWVDFPMHKRGALCFEQILLWKSLETMHNTAAVLNKDSHDDNEKERLTDCFSRYELFYSRLTGIIRELFFDKKKGAFLHAIENGKLNRQVTKFPNIFALVYHYASLDEAKTILSNVLLNAKVPPITTPYMRFYELDALCQMGLQDRVLPEMKAYWGGMLHEGATTFWEKYNPEEHGTEHLAMYGRPYGKSLCHAWGASPLYIIGRYFLGVRPTKPGYKEYEVRPVLGGLEWMEGEVPTPFGRIRIKVVGNASQRYNNVVGNASQRYNNVVGNASQRYNKVGNASQRYKSLTIQIFSDGGKGTLILGNQRIAIPANKEITLNY